MNNLQSASLSVEQLERYGKPFTDFPKEVLQGQGKVMFSIFRRHFGLLGLIPFTFRVLLERRRLLKQYAQQYRDLSKLTPDGAKEITMLIPMFNVIARKKSREQAYEFVKSLFQGITSRALPAFYQLDDLVQCEGDVFDNYKKINVSIFEAGNRDFHVQKIEETENHLRIVVDRCLNVEAGRMFGCPEIAKLGCDHDLAAYPLIDPVVNAEFRRPCTLAKGDSYCDFNFYRKGFAPEGAFQNK